MLFWNNGIKAVVVDGTSIADTGLQREYTVGIFPILRTPCHWGAVAVHSKTTYRLLYELFSIESRALFPHSSEP